MRHERVGSEIMSQMSTIKNTEEDPQANSKKGEVDSSKKERKDTVMITVIENAYLDSTSATSQTARLGSTLDLLV